MQTSPSRLRYHVIGMDCDHDAREIEHAARESGEITDVRVSVSSRMMSVTLAPAGSEEDLTRAVNGIGYRLEPVVGDSGDGTHMTAAYRRALWIVVLLNLGYGVIEMVGGFLSNSQALKADALDFLGDGLITLLGVVAIGWGTAWRARSALLQGIFLGLLGAGVLVNTVVRLAQGYTPEAQLMGVIGIGALIANVAATAVLLPHRAGDANVRAVWMFSRNDAIGNVAVVIAALLVSRLESAWPDIAVAFAMAGLFLQSAWVIIRDARADLRDV